MKRFALPLLSCLALQVATASAAENIVILGDSLSFAYEAEFGFKKTIFNPFTGTSSSIGDGMPPTVRNWIEILSDPAYRGDSFSLGDRDSTTVSIPGNSPFDLYVRQSGNWSIPGLLIHELQQFVYGLTDFNALIAGSGGIGSLLAYSDFNQTTDFNVTDLEQQIQTSAARLTIFIGGNDINSVYGNIYTDNNAGTFVADYMADMTSILDRVQLLKPNLQIVIVNVPHVGITPLVREDYPYDVVKTERVSAVLRDLNGQLANLAAARKLGYADIYTPTLPMLDPAKKLCIHGITFVNEPGTSVGTLANSWLNGPISDNFHPNTSGQTVIANEIIHAFNKRYHTGIAPLTATEMLVGLSGKTSTDLEIPFATWINKFGLAGKPASDDSDGDGISAGVEFALGLSPIRNDADRVTTTVSGGTLDFAYPQRLPGSARYTLVPESSNTLGGAFTPSTSLPTAAADGLYHATMPVGSGQGFLRLKATTSP